jgi:hypothetical protein
MSEVEETQHLCLLHVNVLFHVKMITQFPTAFGYRYGIGHVIWYFVFWGQSAFVKQVAQVCELQESCAPNGV